MKNKYNLLLLTLLLTSCDLINTPSSNIDASFKESEISNNVNESSSNLDVSTSNQDSSNNIDDSGFVDNGIDNEAFEYYTNVKGLSETASEANNLIDNAFAYLNSENKSSKLNYSRRNIKEKKTTLTDNGIELQADQYTSKSNNLSTFVSNIINIKKSVFQLDGKLSNDEYYSDWEGASTRSYYHFDDNRLIYADVNISEGATIPSNIWYFSLEYNEELNTFYYFALSWSESGAVLYNESDLNSYSLIYSDQFAGSSKDVYFCDLTEVEEKIDEFGNEKTFSEYGEQAYQHKYLEHIRSYKGKDTGYLDNHINQCVSDIYDYTIALKRSELSSIEVLTLLEEAPMINTAYYYLTNGYKLPVVDIKLFNEDKKATVAIVEPLIWHTNSSEHTVILFTENNAMEFDPLLFFDDYYTLGIGAHNVSFELLGEIKYEFECIVLNEEYNNYGFDFYSLVETIIPYYEKSEFVQKYIKTFSLYMSFELFKEELQKLLPDIDTLTIDGIEQIEIDSLKEQMKTYIEMFLLNCPF